MADLELNSIGNGDGNNYLLRDNSKIPLSGTSALAGNIIPSTDNTYNLGSSSKPFRSLYAPLLYGSSGSALQIFCGASYSDGSFIQVGSTWITLSSANEVCYLNLSSDGVLEYNGTVFKPIYDNTTDLGLGDRRWKTVYCATGSINTSDSRLKNSVKDIDDKLLDAWGNIEPKQYKFNDATEKKGEKARLHTGYLAQDIQTECEKQGVNASDYGLFCHDSWEEQEEKKDENGQVIEPYRAKGDLYALRYEEALVVECAYLRRENNKLKQLLQNHEERLKALEK